MYRGQVCSVMLIARATNAIDVKHDTIKTLSAR